MEIKDKELMAQNKLEEVLGNENATQGELAAEILNSAKVMAEKAYSQVKAEYDELKNVTDNNVLAARGIYALTAEETAFYNEVTKKSGFDETLVWPETIFEKVFEGLEKDRPLLKFVTFSPTVGNTKIIRARRKGVAVFGPLHKDLEGQLDAEFGVTDFSQLALTAFFLISNDTLDLGPRWINRFIQICLKEAVAEAWEDKIINGTGNNEPIGILKDLDGAVTGGVYADKKTSGTLSFASDKILSELTGVMKGLSKFKQKIGKDDEGVDAYRNVVGKVHMIINPDDYFNILNAVGSRNLNGDWTYKFPLFTMERIIPSEKFPAGKVAFIVEDGYEATQSRPTKIYEYKQTFAMRRATLYAIDMLGNGQPVDNSMVAIYDIAPSA